MSEFELPSQIETAAARLKPHLAPTPFRFSPWLSERLGAEVHLKLECVQPTGSFKVRGAFAKLLSIRAGAVKTNAAVPLRAVAASTGNHGCAVAFALSRLGGEGTVFVSNDAAPMKVAAMKRLGVEVRTVGDDCLEAEAAGRKFAAETGAVYVAPYNDLEVVAGQGTIGLEMDKVVPELDWVFGSLGGGGMLGGIASWFKQTRPTCRVVACSPQNSRVMMDSLKAGRILDQASTPTLSDGTAGGVESGSVTFEIVRASVDDFVALTEEQIAEAMLGCLREESLLVEGAAGAAIAGALELGQQYAAEVRGTKIGIVICGANVGMDVIRRLLR